ncbi:hypothetical protein MMC07_004898 [Pseudocyphellaria aurata]|nr:hypothetical protein [Pseudocyphellaria aurata]
MHDLSLIAPENRDIHQTVPDHRVELTQDGWKQANEAGVKLRSLLQPTDTLHFFTSPYRRTRETTEGILNALTSDQPTPSPFPRSAIKVYEEPRLREQDFGNYQPSSAEMSAMWQERARYGHFFYRIPNGESAADAYDRISGFNESLWRSFGEEDFASVCVLVTHGLMTRVFLMKWYHFSVEYFEDLRNVNHCEFVVMKLNKETGKFALQNQLRTWSGLRREKAEAVAPPESPIPVRKRWGDNSEQDAGGFGRRQLARRQNTADLFADDIEGTGTAVVQQEDWVTKMKHPKTASREKRAVSDAAGRYNTDWNGTYNVTAAREAGGAGAGVRSSATRSRNNSSTIPERSTEHNGGGLNGAGSGSGSGSSEDEDSEVRKRLRALPARNSMALALHGDLDIDLLVRNPATATAAAAAARISSSDATAEPRANALGDQSDVDDDVIAEGSANVKSHGGGVGSGVEGDYVRNENVARDVY